ncbi:Gti1/Pac2 family-domain-containing protein [Mycena rosella]|uniref:Gti1/Pac2 family-domain-containing protein n=1 Tax=Mycena rosella TaxID=1033263 RepID=A0AAD7GDC4_MYCRO|nr:Gti1/Pac2 family-domain-containing protein [Mycena rosella]
MSRQEITSCVTHPSLHIRNITDAQRVLEAVRLNILPLVKRRLDHYERAQLRSGNVFVWEESETDNGLVRWTEGRRWSQSRMRGDCLFYEEKIGATPAEKEAKAMRRAVKASESGQPVPAPPKRRDRPSKVNGLTKQTYSVTVQPPGAARPKKWHLVAYLAADDSSRIPVVQDYAYLRNIRVPGGIFLTSSYSRPTSGSFDTYQPPEIAASSSSSTQGSPSPVVEALQLQPPLIPFPREHNIVLPPISPAHSPIILPSLSSLGYPPPGAPTHPRYFPTASRIVPRHHITVCSDDRRILDRFRVVI